MAIVKSLVCLPFSLHLLILSLVNLCSVHFVTIEKCWEILSISLRSKFADTWAWALQSVLFTYEESVLKQTSISTVLLVFSEELLFLPALFLFPPQGSVLGAPILLLEVNKYTYLLSSQCIYLYSIEYSVWEKRKLLVSLLDFPQFCYGSI